MATVLFVHGLESGPQGRKARALASQPIDAVVGSSFGGAVAVGLLAEGAWSGPTLLMCPAFGLVAGRAWMPRPVARVGQERVVVVHRLRDGTVPVAHSQALVAGSEARLVLVDDDHRLSASATAENLRVWLALVGVVPG